MKVLNTLLKIALGSAALLSVGAYAYLFTPPSPDPTSLPKGMVSLYSAAGQRLLRTSHYQQDYESIKQYFVGQERRAYCGVASSVIALNALAKRPRYTQQTLFDDATDKIVPAWRVALNGLTLDELEGILAAKNARANTFYAEDEGRDQFRQKMKTILTEDNDYLLVNYSRQTLGQEWVGHISPIAAYNEAEDKVLVFDVTDYQYPPTWIDVDVLWVAMLAKDIQSNKSRGYLIVSNT